MEIIFQKESFKELNLKITPWKEHVFAQICV